MSKTEAEQIVRLVLDALNDRSGFDGWWDSLDYSIKQEVMDELIELITETE